MVVKEYDLIVITISLKIQLKDLEELIDDSRPLISATKRLRKELEEKDIEIFLEKENILVTEEGYKVILYAESLKDIHLVEDQKN